MKNAKAMDACILKTLEKLNAAHKVTELDPGNFKLLKVQGIMKFHVKQYRIEELGNLCIMTMNMGLMQMSTLVFTPLEKDLPLLSCDYIYILGKRKAYIELYDLVAEKDDTYRSWLEKYDSACKTYADLENTTVSSNWYDNLLSVAAYKQLKAAQDDCLIALHMDILRIYLDQAASYPRLTAEEKVEKARIIKEYSDRLIGEGGIATNNFKKSLGEDMAREFFDKVFFAAAR